MKKRLLLFFLTALIVLGLAGCNNTEENSSPSQNPSVTPSTSEQTPPDISPMSKYQEVLQNKAKFYSTDADKELSITELNQAVSSDSSVTVEILKFAVINLENDDIPEVILWLKVNENDYYGSEVLSYKDGVIYGYTLWYRSFMELKEDGTFSFSGGAADSGYGTIKFTKDDYIIDSITYSESSVDEDNNVIISYYVNKESATEEDFNAAINLQGEKPDVAWYEFTDDNITALLSDNK